LRARLAEPRAASPPDWFSGGPATTKRNAGGYFAGVR
jgi:hypothetical protein